MIINFLLATRNASKIVQIRAAFAGLKANFPSLEDVGIEGKAVEDGTTLEENARKKAEFAYRHRGRVHGVVGGILAEDTGLFIHALNGRPGIHAARWAGPGKKTEDVMHFTLEQLRDIPEEKRTGAFQTSAVFTSMIGDHTYFGGLVEGRFLTAPRGECQLNMPYSAIFVPNGQENGRQKVWAEMTPEEENAISHRGKALKLLRAYLETFISRYEHA